MHPLSPSAEPVTHQCWTASHLNPRFSQGRDQGSSYMKCAYRWMCRHRIRCCCRNNPISPQITTKCTSHHHAIRCFYHSTDVSKLSQFLLSNVRHSTACPVMSSVCKICRNSSLFLFIASVKGTGVLLEVMLDGPYRWTLEKICMLSLKTSRFNPWTLFSLLRNLFSL